VGIERTDDDDGVVVAVKKLHRKHRMHPTGGPGTIQLHHHQANPSPTRKNQVGEVRDAR